MSMIDKTTRGTMYEHEQERGVDVRAGSIGEVVSSLQQEALVLAKNAESLINAIGATLCDPYPVSDDEARVLRESPPPCDLSNNLSGILVSLIQTRMLLQDAERRVQL